MLGEISISIEHAVLMNIQHAKDNVDPDYFKCNAIYIVDISALSRYMSNRYISTVSKH
jgi:hypothetical protein